MLSIFFQKYIFKKNFWSFLHINKCGGTNLDDAFKKINKLQKKIQIIKRSHNFKLRHLSQNQSYLISIRDPISRFVSGYYSRYRKGYPVTYKEWSLKEKDAFEKFPSANILAESLYEKNKRKNKDAFEAMNSIYHLNFFIKDFIEPKFFKKKKPIYIFRTKNLKEDFKKFTKIYNLPNVNLSTKRKKKHNTIYGKKMKYLSNKAIKNLRTYYKKDFLVYKKILDYHSKNFN